MYSTRFCISSAVGRRHSEMSASTSPPIVYFCRWQNAISNAERSQNGVAEIRIVREHYPLLRTREAEVGLIGLAHQIRLFRRGYINAAPSQAACHGHRDVFVEMVLYFHWL